jgi:formamidopyrimidine-DNA glycosylase
MPEITEVYITAQYLLSKIKNKYISNIKILSGSRYGHQELNGLDLFINNSPLKIIDIKTKGKFLWFELQNKKKQFIYLMCNFGLTGGWSFENNTYSKIKFRITNKDSDKKQNLYFFDQRNFGIIAFTDDINILNTKINKLARDYLQTPFTDEEFINKMKELCTKKTNKNKLLIKVLMEQDNNKTIGSGIGNYIAVESLYLAKLSPYRTICSLTDKELKKLNKSIKKIIKMSYYSNTNGYIDQYNLKININKSHDIYPEIEIDKTKDFEFKVYQQKEDPKGNIVLADKIIKDRTTYWVKKIQK